jgi:hypothetical protein
LGRGGPTALQTKGDSDDAIALLDDQDMRLAGLTARSRAIYVKAVRRLAAHYRRSPDELSEEEVRTYLVKLRDGGAARGTFKVALTPYSSSTSTLSAATGRCFLKKDCLPKHKRLPHALADEQIRRLLGCIESPVHRVCRMWKTHRNRRWLFPNRAGTRPVTYDVLSPTLAAAVRAPASPGG